MSFFRYPGGKTKLRDQIIRRLIDIAGRDEIEYREPFFGGGSIGINIINCNKNVFSVWINDKDYGISCLWTSVINNPEKLKHYINSFKPSVEAFNNFKKDLTEKIDTLSSEDAIDYGFKKLAIHQLSYSGLGTKSGGPLGGKNQDSKYKIDCRWSPKSICKKIDSIHYKFSKLYVREDSCTNLDFDPLVHEIKNNSVIYLDPPYYVKGNDLYQHGFTENDHIRLAESLKKTNNKWLLSYDDCPQIRALYDGCIIEEVKEVKYSITSIKDKESGKNFSTAKTELIIMPSVV